MRLKTFVGATMAEAMEQVSAQLGDEAIIVSSGRGPGGRGARVTAALERNDDTDDFPVEEEAQSLAVEDVEGIVRQALTFHGIPNAVRQPILEALVDLERGDPVASLGAALGQCFSFAPLQSSAAKTGILLIGPPGNGKTLVAAKLATRARVASAPFRLISADTVHAGGAAALTAIARILDSELTTADGPQALTQIMSKQHTGPKSSLTIIDTMGANPYDENEMERLEGLIGASGAEPVLVLAAGADPVEAISAAVAFARLGVKRMIITRLDASRRYGGLLAAAFAAKLAFAEAGLSSHVPDGLAPIGAQSLAGFLLPDPIAIPNLRKRAS